MSVPVSDADTTYDAHSASPSDSPSARLMVVRGEEMKEEMNQEFKAATQEVKKELKEDFQAIAQDMKEDVKVLRQRLEVKDAYIDAIVSLSRSASANAYHLHCRS